MLRAIAFVLLLALPAGAQTIAADDPRSFIRITQGTEANCAAGAGPHFASADTFVITLGVSTWAGREGLLTFFAHNFPVTDGDCVAFASVAIAARARVVCVTKDWRTNDLDAMAWFGKGAQQPLVIDKTQCSNRCVNCK